MADADQPLHSVELTELAFGGDAVGRLPDGKVVFVPAGAPGDRVSLRLTREKKSLAWGEIVEVLEPGPGRRQPPCPLVGECGGCAWQHLDYPRQVSAKEQMFRAILDRAGADLERLIPSPAEFGYRRRARMRWRANSGGDVTLGFMKANSRDLLDVQSCPLFTPALQRAADLFRRDLALQGAGTVVLVEGAGGQVSVSPRGRENEAQAVRLLPAEAGDLWGSAACFCQANAAQEATLRALVASLVPPGVVTALELHAGVGTLTVALAPLVEQLVAVESWAPSVALLRRNTGELKVQVHEVTAEKMLARGASFDLVVLDPPREGAKGLAPLIAATGAGRVIYVSCDAMTLSRDARALAEHGYKPTKATALDMMPQTHHGELVVAFDR